MNMTPDTEKTAFSVPGCYYEFQNMPFGLCNVLATFQRPLPVLLGNILIEIKGEEVLVY